MTAHVQPQPEARPEAPEQVVDFQTEAAWLQARKLGVGGSESAALFGLSPWSSPLSLWGEKTGQIPRPFAPYADQQERMDWGHLMEPVIAARYQMVTNRGLWSFSRFCIAPHPRLPFMFATPDRWIISSPDRPGRGVLQIKNTSDADAWEHAPPAYVQCQVQHELACTGREWGAVAVCINGNKLRHWDIERNETFIAELERQCELFWDRVQRGEAPPADDGHKATLQAVKALHPLDDGSEIALPPEADQLLQAWLDARAEALAADKRADANEAQLRALIGPATFATTPSGRLLSLKHTTVRAHVIERSETTYRTLREAKARTVKKGKTR